MGCLCDDGSPGARTCDDSGAFGECLCQAASSSTTASTTEPGTSTAPADSSGGSSAGSDATETSAESSSTGACEAVPGDPPARETGTLSDPQPSDCNVGGIPADAECFQMMVSCADVPDIGVMVAITEPQGAASGTVVTLFGGGGTVAFDEGFPAGYLSQNLRVVQLVFPSAWEETPSGSIKAAACRVSTVIEWAFTDVHDGDLAAGFCAHMHSGGSGGLGYALAHYGAERWLDYAMVDAGPVFGRMDHGCDPEATGLGTTTRSVCDELPNGTFAYGGAAGLINGWENTTSCGAPYDDASPADVAQWADDSVVSPGADYDYPQTETAFWYCANNANEAAGQGSWFVDEVTSNKSVTCVTGECQIEPAWTDPDAKNDMIAAMAAQCIPRHCAD